MKVIFICDGYYPEKNAASYCAYQLIHLMRKRNVECDVLNVTPAYDIPFEIEEDGGTIYSIRDDYRVDYSEAKKETVRFFKYVLFRIFGRLNKCGLKAIKYKKILRMFHMIGNKYDVIVPVISDFNNGVAAMMVSKEQNIPYVVYQVDPIGSNETQASYKKQLQQYEKELYRNAAAVLTTPPLKNEKQADPQYDNSKIIAAEFPNVINLAKARKANPHKIVCAFCGNLISGVRDCRYVLELFSIINSKDIFLMFAGCGQENIINEYANGALKGHLKAVGKLDKSDATSFIQNADFLINIGNRMTNQVPSKLFDYISTTVPIINVCKNDNCPTINYMQRYGLSINIIETQSDEQKKEQADKLNEFILNSIDKRVEWESIRKEFYTNTPQYVESQLWQAIQIAGGYV